jgi:hypothetical protein
MICRIVVFAYQWCTTIHHRRTHVYGVCASFALVHCVVSVLLAVCTAPHCATFRVTCSYNRLHMLTDLRRDGFYGQSDSLTIRSAALLLANSAPVRLLLVLLLLFLLHLLLFLLHLRLLLLLLFPPDPSPSAVLRFSVRAPTYAQQCADLQRHVGMEPHSEPCFMIPTFMTLLASSNHRPS